MDQTAPTITVGTLTVNGPSVISDAEIDRRIDLHTPQDQATRDTLDNLRAQFKALYRTVRDTTPVCREQSLAFTHLEDALAAAIAAVVRPPAASHPITELVVDTASAVEPTDAALPSLMTLSSSLDAVR